MNAKKIFGRIFGKPDPDTPKSIINLPPIPNEDITADNLSDMLNNGSAIIGETDYMHAGDMSKFYEILGHHTMSSTMNIICAYTVENDVLCKYDMLADRDSNGEIRTLFALSEAWKMTPAVFGDVVKKQISGFYHLYEDKNWDIFDNTNTVDLEYEEIIEEMSTKDHAVFTLETLQKYKERSSSNHEK